MKEIDPPSYHDYTIHHGEFGNWVMGQNPPLDEISSLLKSWDYHGLKVMSRPVAHVLGAVVAVCRNRADEGLWLETIRPKNLST